VLLVIHLLARFLTTLVDIAQLSLPNKLAGVLFGAVRALFTLSVAFNLFMGYSDGAIPPAKAREASTLYSPGRRPSRRCWSLRWPRPSGSRTWWTEPVKSWIKWSSDQASMPFGRRRRYTK
jgi:hypothetical protein